MVWDVRVEGGTEEERGDMGVKGELGGEGRRGQGVKRADVRDKAYGPRVASFSFISLY